MDTARNSARQTPRKRWLWYLVLPVASLGAAASGWALFGPVPDYLQQTFATDDSTIQQGYTETGSQTREQEGEHSGESDPPRGGPQPVPQPSPTPVPSEPPASAPTSEPSQPGHLTPVEPPTTRFPEESGTVSPSPPTEEDDEDGDNEDDESSSPSPSPSETP